MVDWAIPVAEDGSLALAARSDGCCRRTLHGIHGVVDRMQGAACPFDCFRRHRPLHGATRVHGTADTARNKQPGKEAHKKSQKRRNGCAERRLLPLAFPRLSTQQVNVGKLTRLLRAGAASRSSIRCHVSSCGKARTEHGDMGEHALAHVADSGPYNFASAVLRVDQDRCLVR
jgi:hypothetical protein